MTDAAYVASEHISAPQSDAVVNEAPAAVEPSQSTESGEREAKTPSFRESFEKALSAVNKAEQPAEKDSEPVGDASERARNPDGTFAAKTVEESNESSVETQPEAKPASPLDTPPERFSPDAKAAWAQAPESVRGEINRAVAELENGLSQYKSRAEYFSPLEGYAQRAQQQGTDLKTVLDNYLGWENLLSQDPGNGFVALLQNMGQDPLAFAQFILSGAGVNADNQDDPGRQSQIHQRQLANQHSELNDLRQTVGELRKYIDEMQEHQATQQIAEISKDKPGFDDLRPLMSQLMQSRMAQTLDEAYSMAARLKPEAIPVPPQPAHVSGQPASSPDMQVTPPTAQTRKAGLSVTGAPSSGSNPANRKPPTSTREALERSFASVGFV